MDFENEKKFDEKPATEQNTGSREGYPQAGNGFQRDYRGRSPRPRIHTGQRPSRVATSRVSRRVATVPALARKVARVATSPVSSRAATVPAITRVATRVATSPVSSRVAISPVRVATSSVPPTATSPTSSMARNLMVRRDSMARSPTVSVPARPTTIPMPSTL